MGAAHEQPEGPGGGDRADGAGVQLNPFEQEPAQYEQMTLLFPSETEQIEAIDHEAESEMPSAFSLPQEDIDHVLRLGGRTEQTRMEVAALFMTGKSPIEIANFLSREYRGGLGLLTDNGRMSAWFGEQGIWLASGDHARDAAPGMYIPWLNAAERIGELMDAGQFATNVELAESQGYYRTQLAQSLWYLRQDFSEMAKDMSLMSSLDSYRSDGFPEDTARLANALADPETLAAITQDMEAFAQVYEQERGILRFHHLNVPAMVNGLHDLVAPWKEYVSEMAAVPGAGQFITEDELDEAVSYGSLMAGGKERIYTFFSETHTTREQTAFLREEYGIGGHSGPFSNKRHSSEQHDSKGIKLEKDGCATVTLTWNAVAKRVAALVKADRYLTEEEKAQLQQAQEPAEPVSETSAEEPQLAENVPPAAEAELEEDDFSDIDPEAVRQRLAEHGIVNGEVVDPDKLAQSPFIQQVEADVERIAAEEAAEEETPVTPEDTSEDRFHVIEVDWYPGRIAYSIWDDQTDNYYENKDGLTVDFVSRWQAEEYRNELVESVQRETTLSPLDRAKKLIDEYCLEEFSESADFDDLTNVGLAFTTITDDEIPIQATVDLVGFKLERYLGETLIDVRQYDSLEALIAGELEGLSFDDLTYASDEQIAAVLAHEEEQADVPIVEQVQAAISEEAFPYSVGDTVYLEDGKPFVIDSIGTSDVHLLDPSLRFPVLRAESRENFLRLMEHYPQEQQAEQSPQQPTVTEEPVAFYPGEQNGLPFDVEIRTLHFGEPEQAAPAQEPAPAQETAAEPVAEPELTPEDAIDRNPISVQIGGEWRTFPDREAAEEALYADYKEQTHRNAQNFHITDDALGEGGPKAKYQANVAAIRLLQHLEAEGLQASLEQQEVLSRYVGWGSLADAFDPNKPAWAQEYQELKSLLTEDEYVAARASTLNAHYTSPTVIKAIYEAVGNMGFQTGNILEPSMGVGNFFGLLPEAMQGSKLYGVELDSITGRIARQLYPHADIKVAGFETTDRRDFYDLAVGNVPFGDYKVNDRPYNKLGFSIHNYFFAKALDQVRPGGVVAFVTSRYTMDAKSPEVRKYLAQRAELLGAIRLPNNAFRANAGTDVVSDIIFLQKRETPIDIDPDWVHLGQTPDGFAINSYFVDHPEMVLGELTSQSTQYGREECTVIPIPSADLAEQLHEAVSHIQGSYQAVELSTEDSLIASTDTIPADPNVKNFSFAAVNGEVYFREDSIMRHVALSDTARQRALGMISLRQTVNELIEYQLEDYPDEAIQAKQHELELAYDAFTAKYGLLNSRPNARVFGDDSSYYLLCSLENVDEDGKLIGKADMFTKRTIRPDRSVSSVDTPVEALAVSIGEHGDVDLPFMSELLGTPGDFDRIIEELSGVIFLDPLEADAEDRTRGWHTADDYLSGNVRAKLQTARLAVKSDPSYQVNVTALEKAQPKDLDASEIDVRLGATWVDREYIQQFMQETFETPFYMRRSIEVKFSPLTAEWQITGKTVPNRHDVAAYVTYGTDRANAYRILEETLNLKDIRIYDTVEDADGKQKRVLNKKETTLAQQKQQAIKDAFQDWVWKDPRRREALCQKYNELFNSTRPREYDGSHIHFVGMNPEITLRDHQRNAIAHVLYGGNTLLAHEVGAGKTFEMAAAAMESKRLGLCQKSLFVVPNHLTTQWANEFLRLYPSAKILVATRKDFETARRKKFCARIATGDYDAVIIGHSQFEKIPVSAERQERLLQEQIDDIEQAIAIAKYQRGENFTIKQMEKTRRSLQARLDKLTSTERKDDVVTFEQLGVDRLFVDESHAFKNLFLYTKMRNVAGLSTSEAQKSSDMYMKCRYMDEITGGRGVVFATGTPVSNSMTELYTVMRYLQYSTLQQKGLTHFDAWASTFGETQTAIELAPEGTGYRARTRFARFFNLPELMAMFKEVADIKTSDQLDLPVPEAHFETVVVQPSEIQKEMVAALSERASKVHAGAVDASEDNMLCITSDGRKIGLDQRLMNPLLPDDPNSKLNACVNNVFRIWQEGTPGQLTQLLFCDMSTPKSDGSFNVYDDIRKKLEARGVPHEEIAFIHDADTEAKKKELFAKVRSGQVRVLLGSTQKMGAGTNVQDRLVAVHHLDVGWRPADMTQRNGRIIRQGNKNKEVHVYSYVTEGTFDAYLYQTLENKQKFISQIMTSKSPVRSCDDVDEQALSYAEIKALCAGSPLIKEKMDLDIDVARLKVLKADFRSKQYRLEDQLLKYFPREIEQQHSNIEGFRQDIATVAAHPHPKDGFAGMTVAGRAYTEKADAGEAILAVCKTANAVEGYPLGSYRGFQMELSFDSFNKEFVIALKGSMTHRVALGTDARGNLIRLDNALNNIPARLEQAQTRLETLEQQREAAQAEVGKPFPQEAELAEKSARLAELDAALNMEGGGAVERDADEPSEGRPSVLANLKQKSSQVPPPRRDTTRRTEEVL
ncbi:MAG: SNF2-related protein [Lachnospiraceae bacterium]|nr:SNF2-related protein [Lachnospiraceae bacterium]